MFQRSIQSLVRILREYIDEKLFNLAIVVFMLICKGLIIQLVRMYTCAHIYIILNVKNVYKYRKHAGNAVCRKEGVGYLSPEKSVLLRAS